jgi:hypothetical protein
MFSQLPGLQALADVKLAEFVSPETLIPVLVGPVVKLIAVVTEAFQLAATVAVWLLLTVPAVAVNVPLLALAAMVMLPGTVSTPRLLERLTATALVVALVTVTVQVALCPLPSVPGAQITEDSCADPDRLKEAVCEVLLALAAISAVSSAEIVPTVTVNPAVVAPDATVTLAGTEASAVLLDSATANPPLGAAPLKVTVHVDVPGAPTIAGEQDRPLSNTPAVRFTGVLALYPFKVAVNAAVWLLLTVPAVAVNVPLLAPVAIVILGGTTNATVLLDKVTAAVLDAAWFSVTMQVALCPVPSIPGAQLTPESCTSATRFKLVAGEEPLALAMIVAV